MERLNWYIVLDIPLAFRGLLPPPRSLQGILLEAWGVSQSCVKTQGRLVKQVLSDRWITHILRSDEKKVTLRPGLGRDFPACRRHHVDAVEAGVARRAVAAPMGSAGLLSGQRRAGDQAGERIAVAEQPLEPVGVADRARVLPDR